MPSNDKKTKTTKSREYGSVWKQKLHDLQVPSGEWCQVRRPGIQKLIKDGVLHSMDSLTGIVQTDTLPKAEGKPKVDVKSLLNDEKRLNDMFATIDKIVLAVVVQPEIHPAPADDSERDEDLIYVDELGEEDKTFIMQYALGGSADLQQFRQAAKEAVGGVSAGEGSE